MSASYIKRPADAIAIPVDFAEFIAEHPAAVITYTLRADVGVVIDTELLGEGSFSLHVTGGVAGRVYRFGIEAVSDDGDSKVSAVTLRLLDPNDWDGIPVVGDIGSGSNLFFLVDVDGNVLVDGSGNALVIAG